MTQKEKARAYDKVVNKLRHFIVQGVDPLITMADVQDFFPELSESEDEKIRKELIEHIKANCESDFILFQKFSPDDVLAWLEKQGEQEQVSEFKADDWYVSKVDGKIHNIYHSDKVEPKFKVGDWIVQGCNILKIRCVGDEYYCFETVGGYVDDMLVSEIDSLYHLWTIQDAEDGDVLATKNFIFIFKNIDDGNGVHYYCHYEISKHEDDNQFDIALPQSLMGRVGNSIIHYSPATKEQRDALFAAMKESGYEWDAEKKELRKIEQKPAEWSKEDERIRKGIIYVLEQEWVHLVSAKGVTKKEMIDWLEKQGEKKSTELPKGEDYGIDGLWNAQRILEKTLGKVEGYQTDDGILEHECAINAVKELYEQKPTWSEEDKIRLDRICKTLWKNRKGDTDEIYQQEQDIDWLKSLKKRMGEQQ